MKTRTLATVVILICSLVLAPSLVRADQDDWYQGRRGHWIQQPNGWMFRDVDGDEYRQYGNSWGWSKAQERAEQEQEQWYQGRRGQWVRLPNGWLFRDVDGDEYRQYGDSKRMLSDFDDLGLVTIRKRTRKNRKAARIQGPNSP